MTDLNSSLESPGSSVEETPAAANSVATSCEAMMWEAWSTQPSTGDEASTSKLDLLPELVSSSNSRLSFQQSDLLSNMLSSFHPLSQHSSAGFELSHNRGGSEHSPEFLQEGSSEADTETSSFGDLYINRQTSRNSFLGSIACPLPSNHSDSGKNIRREDLSNQLGAKSSAPLQLWQSLGPESPSSPLACHNIGYRHSHGEKWETGSQSHSPWPTVSNTSSTIQLLGGRAAENEVIQVLKSNDSEISKSLATLQQYGDHGRQLNLNHSSTTNHPEVIYSSKFGPKPSASSHTDVLMSSTNSSFLSIPTAWSTPEYSMSGPSTRSEQFMNFVRIAQEQNSVPISGPSPILGSYVGCSNRSKSGISRVVSQETPTAKNRLLACEGSSGPAPKRPSYAAHSDSHADQAAAMWNSPNLRRSSFPSILTSQAMEIYAIGPALNTNGKPRARRGSATDPQSVYARVSHKISLIRQSF